MKKQNRMKYNQGSLVTKKSIGDLDLSLSGSAEGGTGSGKRNYFGSTTVTAEYGPLKFTETRNIERIKIKYASDKFKYKDKELSYTHTTKNNAKITASVGKDRATLSIFKELP